MSKRMVSPQLIFKKMSGKFGNFGLVMYGFSLPTIETVAIKLGDETVVVFGW